MKALFNGKEIEIELSEESKKELEEIRKKIDPDGMLEGVRGSEPLWSFLLYEIKANVETKHVKEKCDILRKEVYKLINENRRLKEFKIENS